MRFSISVAIALLAVALSTGCSDDSGEESDAGIAPVETGFEILEELGRGAFSRVYRAVDRALGREVALKVLKSDIPLSSHDKNRLIKEARTLASLDHPNILRMLSVDQDEGDLRLCLEKRGLTP